MATTLRPVSHEDRLSLVEHLDELRSRLIICIAAFGVAFAFCIWQDDAILKIINQPLVESASTSTSGSGGGRLEQAARNLGASLPQALHWVEVRLPELMAIEKKSITDPLQRDVLSGLVFRWTLFGCPGRKRGADGLDTSPETTSCPMGVTK